MSAVAEKPPVLPAHEVRGPVAFGDDSHRFWTLVRQDVISEFKLRYHNSFLGVLWSIANPLLMFIVLYFWFSRIIRFGDEIPNFAAMIIFNLMLFRFFTEAIGTSLGSLVAREGLVRRAYFPAAAIPFAKVLGSTLDLLLTIPVVFAIMFVVGVEPTWTWLGLPLIVALLWIFALGASLLLSALYVTIRDIHQIWTVGARVLFFATPILYPIEFAPDRIRELLQLNPLAPIFNLTNHWMLDPDGPNVLEAAGGWTGLIIPALLFVGITVSGFIVFVRRTPTIPEAM